MKALFKLILKGSLVSMIAMAAATGCGDDADNGGTDNEGGESSTAGTKNTSGTKNSAGEPSTDGGTSTGNGGTDAQGGDTTGVGGASGGSGGSGAGEGGIDSGGAGPDPFGGAANGGAVNEYMGPPIAKFCNTLLFDENEGGAPGVSTTMRLEIGTGLDKVTFTASTDECVPADGDACTEIPSGPAVVVNLFDVDDDTLPIDFATANIAENDQLVFYTDVDNNGPIWNVSALNPGFACEDVTYDDVLAIE